MTKETAIIGGSGYTGGELIRFLLGHKDVNLVKVTSRQNQGSKVTEVHQNLRGFTDLRFTNEPLSDTAREVDLMFFALPHATSMKKVPEIIDETKIIDLSSDYRLKDLHAYESYYTKHSSPELIDRFVYGLPEINRKNIAKSKNVANPGCFPTGALLALTPLAEKDLLRENVVIDAKTGSSGSGTTPSFGTHHPERACDLRAYKVLAHQHHPEIVQELETFNHDGFDLTFVTHSTPMIRGIFITAYVFLEDEISKEELTHIYNEYYSDALFVRVVEQARCSPVRGTNFCDLSLECKGDKVVITAALDNLVKGAAGTAVQNMNLMFGLKESRSLMFSGLHP
ncbi:MAG: N-acetyl-gamma-glutamyl-phosphate reductase [Thermoplasmatota archaeon]